LATPSPSHPPHSKRLLPKILPGVLPHLGAVSPPGSHPTTARNLWATSSKASCSTASPPSGNGTTANGDDFAYIKAAVDKYVTADGTITGYKASGHTLDDIEMGRAVLLVYRVTQQEKYAKAAKFLHDQLDQQPRTASGGYWHKQIYPNQMWLDGAYMAEPFRAAYAATFQQSADFDDIAKQLLLMDVHMRDPKPA
jgi:uncharacterized protein YyaL (SSP411 family)